MQEYYRTQRDRRINEEYDTFVLKRHPIQHILPFYWLTKMDLIHRSQTFYLMSIDTPAIDYGEEYVVQHQCFHNGKIIHTSGDQYSIEFGLLKILGLIFGTFSLTINDFTVDSLGEYTCNIKLISSRNNTINMKTETVKAVTESSNHNLVVLLIKSAEIINNIWIEDEKVMEGLISEFVRLRFQDRILNTVMLTDIPQMLKYVIVLLVLTVIVLTPSVLNIMDAKRKRQCLKQLKELLETHNTPATRGDRSFTYDVFISHDPAGVDFVKTTLLPGLENRGYKVCFGPRDLDLNQSSLKNSGVAIENSRKTMCVFSPAYYRNAWCTEMELTAAFTGILNGQGTTDSLLIVLYKPCKIPEILAATTYLDWTDIPRRENFLGRLTRSIGTPRSPQTVTNQNWQRARKRYTKRKARHSLWL